MKKIFRTYSDTEVEQLATIVECTHCGNEWLEEDMYENGKRVSFDKKRHTKNAKGL
ncbi:hypothetical protein [Psychrobacillus sp. NPDC093200]|uniref:hypothetical protein n=1 Tax=Psychrobacillus sp. NPDC093200 TaxID=3390656 RepID=UPI003D04B8EC